MRCNKRFQTNKTQCKCNTQPNHGCKLNHSTSSTRLPNISSTRDTSFKNTTKVDGVDEAVAIGMDAADAEDVVQAGASVSIVGRTAYVRATGKSATVLHKDISNKQP